MVRENETIYEFADFRLIPGEGLLLKNGTPIDLNPKAFAVLSLLVERNGHLVSKSEIMDSIWEDAFIEEGAVSKAVWFIRNALGDTSKERFIQTIPRRGYRFVAPVVVLNDPRNTPSKPDFVSTGYRLPVDPENGEPGSDEDSEASTVTVLSTEKSAEPAVVAEAPPTVKRPWNRVDKSRPYRAYGLVALCIAVVAVIGLGYFLLGTPNSDAGGKVRLAILPLKPIDAANRNELYELGIADALIIQLNSSGKFVVRSLDSVRRYTEVEYDPLSAGREQKVDYVLASNYQIVNSKLRITMQLLNVETGQVEEPYKTEKTVTDIFSAQDSVAREIGAKLTARFGGNIASRPSMSGTTNEGAYRLVLQGMYFLSRRNPKDSLTAFEQALQLDPRYALAWAGKARSHRAVASLGDQADIHDQHRQSMAAIARALELDDDLAEAHSALCENLFIYEHDFARAEAECKRAIDLDPNSAISHLSYAWMLASRGRFEEAIAENQTATDLEPASIFAQRQTGMILFWARRFPEAEEQLKRVNTMEKGFSSQWLVWALEEQGRYSEAYEVWMVMLRSGRNNEEAIKIQETAYKTNGWQGFVRKRAEQEGFQFYTRAVRYAQIGESAKAFEYFEKSLARRESWLIFINVDPRLDGFRSDPRYNEFVQKLDAK